MKKPLKVDESSCKRLSNNTPSQNNTTITTMNGPDDNKTVAARYQGSPGGKIISEGKRKEESFATSKKESNANDILASNGVNPSHEKGSKIEFRNSKNIGEVSNNTPGNNMEYANAAWLHEVGSRPHESALTNHDPIITDTNLAEIDFEDFRNEDLAYAFSCGEEESGSSTDMSICRSEVLFSSMRDSMHGLGMGIHNTGVGLGQMDKNEVGGGPLQEETMKRSFIVEGGPFYGAASAGPKLLGEDLAGSLILIQDSLINLSFSEQVKVNKNNYTLTFSGHVGVGDQELNQSFTRSISESMERNRQPNIPEMAPNTTNSDMTNRMGELNSPGQLTTWSNLGSGGAGGGTHQIRIIDGGSTDTGQWRLSTTATNDEQNTYNNNRQQSQNDEGKVNEAESEEMKRGSEQQNSQKGLPLVDTFMRSRNPNSSREISKRHSSHDDQSNFENTPMENEPNNASSNDTIPMMRSKDSVNQYLKSTATIAKQLISIEEKSSGCSSEDVSSIANPEENYSGSNDHIGTVNNTMLRTQPSGQSASPSTPGDGNTCHEIEPEKSKLYKLQRRSASSWSRNKKELSAYPDLGFLENDVGLWDAFFLHGKNSRSHRSVLKPPVPVEEYLREQKERQLQATAGNQLEIRTIKSANSAAGAVQQQAFWPQQPSIRDLDSLRTLLPLAHQHLLGSPASSHSKSEPSGNMIDTRLPIAKVRPMTAGPSTFSRQNHDLQNQAIKSLFTNNSQIHSNPQIPIPVEQKEGSVQVVKVREAWAPLPEEVAVVEPNAEDGVTRRVPREHHENLNTNEAENMERNLNDAINNNGNEEGEEKSREQVYKDEMASKRRSYHPQEYLSQVLHDQQQQYTPNQCQRSRPNDFPKSGSQNDLCDSWVGEEDEESKSYSRTVDDRNSHQGSKYTDQGSITSTASPQRGDVGLVQYHQPKAAEYPFQTNLCMPPQGVNFDLTHKRALFVTLYTAIERLLACADETDSHTESALARCVLLRDLCPALHAIMLDGMKSEVITSFGRMPTSVWQVVEAVTRQGSNTTGTASSDLIMLLNTRYGSSGSLQSTPVTSVSTPLSSHNSNDQDQRKFAGFVTGLIKMSCLHVWFSKLKWSMDVLLRFYERHAFICALHKETRLLFDELIFCLQRLYSVPSALRIDLPFGTDSDFTLDDIYNHPIGHVGMTSQSSNSRTPTATFASSPASSEGIMSRSGGFAPFSAGCPYGQHHRNTSHTPTSNCCHSHSCTRSCNSSHCCERPSSGFSGSGGPGNTAGSVARRGSMTRSRIPRPISLPKKLEAKLNSNFSTGGISPSPTRSGASIPGATSRSRGRSNGSGNEQSSRASSAKSPGAKPPIVPTLTSGGGKATGSSRPKSLVRDTIRLFDAKSRNRIPLSGGAVVATGRQPTTTANRSDSAVQRRKVSSVRRRERPKSSITLSNTAKSPKEGGGEALAHPGYDTAEISTTKSS